MATVRIKSIGKQNILTDEKFKYIKHTLNTPLQLSSLDWYKDGTVSIITVFYPYGTIVLFPDKSSNDVEYEVTL